MKLWLLDADVIIKLHELDVFDRLVNLHELHVASTVVDEVKYFKRNGQKIPIKLRQTYIIPGRITEATASVEEMQSVFGRLPPLKQQVIHAGEIESLAILVREDELTLCTFDAVAIKILPFLDASERAISAERLLQASGLKLSPEHRLDVRLSEEYFKNNLDYGKREFVQTAL